MLRTRLLWFTVGFSVSAAAIAQFAWRDLWSQRYGLFSQTSQTFDALEARVQILEPIPTEDPHPAQVVKQSFYFIPVLLAAFMPLGWSLYTGNNDAVAKYGSIDSVNIKRQTEKTLPLLSWFF